MSHTVKVTLIADQEIELVGYRVNIYDLMTIRLNSKGKIVGYTTIYKTMTKTSNKEGGQ